MKEFCYIFSFTSDVPFLPHIDSSCVLGTINHPEFFHVSTLSVCKCLHKEIERSGTKQNMECPTSGLLVAKVKEMYCFKMETMTSKGERYPYGGLQVKAELRLKSHDGAVVPGKVEEVSIMEMVNMYRRVLNL
ncbi:hypothetical protein EMCRGX_G013988 [Ephydatia muelleri]